MPSIAPITGKLRNRVIQDISIALGGGTILAYGFWYGVHIKRVEKRDAFYAKLQAEKSA